MQPDREHYIHDFEYVNASLQPSQGEAMSLDNSRPRTATPERPSRLANIRNIVLACAALAVTTPIAAPTTAQADTLVLVQGYLGHAGSFRMNGIVPVLHQRGWIDAGHLHMGPDGRFHTAAPEPSGSNRLYTLELPTEAPVALQAQVLSASIAEIARRHPGEKIAVAAHSAGGVVARFAAVTNPDFGVSTLVTIASPHMGTSTAEVGSMIGNSPLSWVTPFFGASTINRSQVLYRDLWREGPGTMLGWLNRQPHPDLRYVAVIRTNDIRAPFAGDSVVTGWSQDMNAVPALTGRAERIVTPGEHGLRTADAMLIADVLANETTRTATASAQ